MNQSAVRSLSRFVVFLALTALAVLVAVPAAFAAGQVTAKEAAHLARLNEARAANGLSALKLSTELTAAAKIRAAEIVGTWGHTRPDGTPAYTAVADRTGWNVISENIAAGKGLDTAYNAVDVLMASEGHRKNILTAANVCVGVATYQDDKGEYYWVELFAQVRPARDADKAAEGSETEQTYITSVNDSALTVDGAGVISSGVGTVDYFGGASRASTAELIRESQKNKGRYTLFVLWNTVCGNVHITQLQAEAHRRKSTVSVGNYMAGSDSTLPRIFELDNVDIILVNYLSTLGGDMKGAMDSYWPSFREQNTVWGNALCLRTSAIDETLAKGYGKFFNIDGNPREVLFFLYNGGKMVAKSKGLNQSNTFDQWAKKISELSSAKDSPVDTGSDNTSDAPSETPSGTPSESPSDDPSSVPSASAEPSDNPSSSVTVEGASEKTWSGSGTVDFTVSTLAQIDSISLGGKTLSYTADYTVSSGAGLSKVITFTKSFLDSLPVGSNSITISVSDGSSASVIIKRESQSQPGDASDVPSDSQSPVPSGQPSDESSDAPSAPAGIPFEQAGNAVVPPAAGIVKIDGGGAPLTFSVQSVAVNSAAGTALMTDANGIRVVVSALDVLIRGTQPGQEKRLPVRIKPAWFVRSISDTSYADLITSGNDVSLNIDPSDLYEGKNEISFGGVKGNGEELRSAPFYIEGVKASDSDNSGTSDKRSSGGCSAVSGSFAMAAFACLLFIRGRKAA